VFNRQKGMIQTSRAFKTLEGVDHTGDQNSAAGALGLRKR